MPVNVSKNNSLSEERENIKVENLGMINA